MNYKKLFWAWPGDPGGGACWYVFALLPADLGVLLGRGQGGSQGFLPLALGPLGHRGGDGDGRLHDVHGRVLRQVIQLCVRGTERQTHEEGLVTGGEASLSETSF